MQMNMQNFVALMKLWEYALVQKSVAHKRLLKMKPARTGCKNKKSELCTLMRLWENALAEKSFAQRPA
jgi:hypothetical protein